MKRSGPPERRSPLRAGKQMRRGGPVKPVSDRRRDENVERRALADSFGPDPVCRFPGCSAPADDLHELIRRSQWRGGLVDRDNVVPICRPHHDWVTTHPDEAHDLGMAKWGWER